MDKLRKLKKKIKEKLKEEEIKSDRKWFGLNFDEASFITHPGIGMVHFLSLKPVNFVHGSFVEL